MFNLLTHLIKQDRLKSLFINALTQPVKIAPPLTLFNKEEFALLAHQTMKFLMSNAASAAGMAPMMLERIVMTLMLLEGMDVPQLANKS